MINDYIVCLALIMNVKQFSTLIFVRPLFGFSQLSKTIICANLSFSPNHRIKINFIILDAIFYFCKIILHIVLYMYVYRCYVCVHSIDETQVQPYDCRLLE